MNRIAIISIIVEDMSCTAEMNALLASKKNTDTPQSTLTEVWELIRNYAPDSDDYP